MELNKPYTIEGDIVTFFDANHCPGSVIILFELKNGESYLHTGIKNFKKKGDFRYHPKLLQIEELKPFLKGGEKRLTAVFLDTT
jgi:DNA cross-link repair 1A protein